jgi:hypothetical protein
LSALSSVGLGVTSLVFSRALLSGKRRGDFKVIDFCCNNPAMTNYDDDVIAWANEQAALLTSGQFTRLDVERIIWLIEGTGNQEVGHFYGDLSVVLRHLLTWKYCPGERTRKLRSLIITRRRNALKTLSRTPSLSKWLTNESFWLEIWEGEHMRRNLHISGLASPAWTPETVINEAFFPD